MKQFRRRPLNQTPSPRLTLRDGPLKNGDRNMGGDEQNYSVIPSGAQDQSAKISMTPIGIRSSNVVNIDEMIYQVNNQSPPKGLLDTKPNETVPWYRSVFNVQENSFLLVTSLVSQRVLQTNLNRMVLEIQNNGAANIFVDFGQTANAGSSRIIRPGVTYAPTIAPIDSIDILGALAGMSVIVIEGNI